MGKLLVHGYHRIDDALFYAILRKNPGNLKKVKLYLEKLARRDK